MDLAGLASSPLLVTEADASEILAVKAAKTGKKEFLTWDVRNGFGYDWFAVAMTGFVVTMYSLAKLSEAYGEQVVGMMLLVALCCGVAIWISVGIRNKLWGKQPRPRVDLSGLPLWRVAVFHITNVLLYWQLFYTMGLPYLIAAALFQAGVSGDDSSWIWTFLFPISFGAVQSPQSWTDLYTMGASFINGTIPFYLTSIFTEAFLVMKILPADRRPKDTYSLQDAMVCTCMAMLGMISGKLWIIGWAGPVYQFVYNNYRITDAFDAVDSTLGFWLCMITADFFFYVYHRTSHVMSWLWTAHSVHHSSEEFNLTLGPRESFLEWATPTTAFSSFPMALFFPPQMMIASAQIRLAWQFWLHVVCFPESPWVELVFATPSLHRVHHAKNHDRLGRNFGAIFSIWDRLFGTFQPEFLDEDEAELFYGVIPATNSWDPVWINVQFWWHMIGPQTRWDSWMAPFRHWTPPQGKCPKLGSRLNPRAKYSVRPASSFWMSYAAFEAAIFVVVCSVAVNTSSLWDSTAIQLSLGVSPHVASLIQGLLALSMGLWTSNCIGMLFTKESMRTLYSEALRQFVLLICFTAYVANYIDLAGSSWSLYLAAYAAVRAVALVKLWKDTLQLMREDCTHARAEEGRNAGTQKLC